MKHIEGNNSITPFLLFSHCFINFAGESLFKFKKITLVLPFGRYFSELEQVIAQSTIFAACRYMLFLQAPSFSCRLVKYYIMNKTSYAVPDAVSWVGLGEWGEVELSRTI